MTHFVIQCLYCGKTWEQTIYILSEDQLKSLRCFICKDKNLKIKEKESIDNDPFGYNKGKKRVSKTK